MVKYNYENVDIHKTHKKVLSIRSISMISKSIVLMECLCGMRRDRNNQLHST